MARPGGLQWQPQPELAVALERGRKRLMARHSRRDFLKAGTAAAVVYACGTSAATPIQLAGSPSNKLQPFPLSFVRLSPGIFKEQADINTRYLDSLAVDRLLHSFRLTAGISSRAVPYG